MNRLFIFFIFLISNNVVSSQSQENVFHTNKTKVFLLAGQSNMDGRGDASKITKQDKKELKLAQNNISYYYKGTTNNIKEPIIIDGVLDVTDPWDYVKKKFRIEKCFGPELFFGIELAKKYPDEKFLFIKRSEGGTSLYGAWNPNWTLEKAQLKEEEHKRKLYKDFIEIVDLQLEKLEPGSYEIAGMLWIQGESDSGNRHGPLPTEKYAENLTSLIEKVRLHYKVDDLPFLMLGVGSNKVINKMKETSLNLSNVTLIERSLKPHAQNYTPRYTHDWNGKPANHYNYTGMKKIGQLFFENYSKLYGNYIK